MNKKNNNGVSWVVYSKKKQLGSLYQILPLNKNYWNDKKINNYNFISQIKNIWKKYIGKYRAIKIKLFKIKF